MFAFKKDREPSKKERPPFDPRSRVGLYALCGLYLAYLLYQMAGPYFKGLPSAPSTPLFLLGAAVLGGGSAALLYLAWRMYRMPVPAEEDPAEEETPALQENAPFEMEEDTECEAEEDGADRENL